MSARMMDEAPHLAHRLAFPSPISQLQPLVAPQLMHL
jgi:hypothetical protein